MSKKFERAALLDSIEAEFGKGCAAICEERARQKEVKGYDLERDSHLYKDEELAEASVTYALSEKFLHSKSQLWPWDIEMYNPTPNNRLREFQKSGALMAAQIDVTILLNN
jgi:hypothetical protein